MRRMRGNFKKMAARGDLGGFEVKGHALLCPPFSPFLLCQFSISITQFLRTKYSQEEES